jgi:Tfp pilus assembly protein FimT
MKSPASSPNLRWVGMTLIEVLVYMAVLTAILGTAMVAFYRYWDASNHLRRNAKEIVSALHAGEQWRGDVRRATGPIELARQGGGEELRVPTGAGEIIYRFSTNAVLRQGGPAAAAQVLLANVKSSQMEADPRGGVEAWRWELELQRVEKRSRLRPLFTFEAAAGAATKR